MPSPKKCAEKFKPGTAAYDRCVNYKQAPNEMSRVRSDKKKKGGYQNGYYTS